MYEVVKAEGRWCGRWWEAWQRCGVEGGVVWCVWGICGGIGKGKGRCARVQPQCRGVVGVRVNHILVCPVLPTALMTSHIPPTRIAVKQPAVLISDFSAHVASSVCSAPTEWAGPSLQAGSACKGKVCRRGARAAARVEGCRQACAVRAPGSVAEGAQGGRGPPYAGEVRGRYVWRQAAAPAQQRGSAVLPRSVRRQAARFRAAGVADARPAEC